MHRFYCSGFQALNLKILLLIYILQLSARIKKSGRKRCQGAPDCSRRDRRPAGQPGVLPDQDHCVHQVQARGGDDFLHRQAPPRRGGPQPAAACGRLPVGLSAGGATGPGKVAALR